MTVRCELHQPFHHCTQKHLHPFSIKMSVCLHLRLKKTPRGLCSPFQEHLVPLSHAVCVWYVCVAGVLKQTSAQKRYICMCLIGRQHLQAFV